jgi:endonuclease/exonuclease/phosphatase family metal-dependent hydrolase
LDSDLLLLQELARPEEASGNEIWEGENPRQGISILSRNGAQIRLSPDYDPALRFAVPVEVILGTREFNLLAVWVQSDPVHYVPNLLEILAHYGPFLARGPSVVAGDFNANPCFDVRNPKHLFGSLSKSLGELGLCSAYHEFTGETHGKEASPTFYFHHHRESPYHLDYVYLPRAWAGSIEAVDVGSFDDFSGLSDHRPVSVTIGDIAGI